jgi:hypothetical protein
MTREWNDNLHVTYESSYLNVLMYQAYLDWAAIETSAFGDSTLATQYTAAASTIKARFNLNTSSGGFWDPSSNYFVAWRDLDGSVHGSVHQAQIGLMAINAGLTDLARSQALLTSIDNDMRANSLELIPENFVDYASGESPEAFQTGVEDGAVYPLFVDFYMQAAARVGERAQSLLLLNNVISRYKSDGFVGFSHLNWSLQGTGGFQENSLPVNANAVAGLYRWVLGIQPTVAGITVAPNISPAAYGSSVTEQIRGTQQVTVSYRSETDVNVNWSSTTLPVSLVWSGQTPGASLTVTDKGWLIRSLPTPSERSPTPTRAVAPTNSYSNQDRRLGTCHTHRELHTPTVKIPRRR